MHVYCLLWTAPHLVVLYDMIPVAFGDRISEINREMEISAPYAKSRAFSCAAKQNGSCH
jgi:hypothetical protein